VDYRAGLVDGEKRIFLTLPGLDLPTLGRPARSLLCYTCYAIPALDLEVEGKVL
jgi:hypothetical protein